MIGYTEFNVSKNRNIKNHEKIKNHKTSDSYSKDTVIFLHRCTLSEGAVLRARDSFS